MGESLLLFEFQRKALLLNKYLLSVLPVCHLSCDVLWKINRWVVGACFQGSFQNSDTSIHK